MAVTFLTVMLYIGLAAAGFVLVIAVCAIFLALLHVVLPAPRDPAAEADVVPEPDEVDRPPDT